MFRFEKPRQIRATGLAQVSTLDSMGFGVRVFVSLGQARAEGVACTQCPASLVAHVGGYNVKRAPGSFEPCALFFSSFFEPAFSRRMRCRTPVRWARHPR